MRYLLCLIILLLPHHFHARQTARKACVNIENLKTHTQFLGNDALAGRGTGSEGEKQAARYIADYFSSLALLPAGDHQTYFQNIPMHGSIPLPASRLTVYNQTSLKELRLGIDYLLYRTGAATYIPTPVPLVFVGYGIIAPEYDYNDYQNVEVEDKVVVFLDGEPASDDESYFEGARPSIYSSPEAKQRLALSRGAQGSIMIPFPARYAKDEWQSLVKEFAFEDISLAYSVTSNMSALVNPATADIFFKDAAYSLAQIFELHEHSRLVSFDLQTRISFKGAFRERDFVARNVVGLCKGNDSGEPESYLLITAHFDHLGIGPAVDGDSIYNGVLDNALGVAALLEIARLITADERGPRRSVLFMAVTGEEEGLLGSSFYTDHPVVPLYKTIANINIDGISAFDQTSDMIGIGAEYSTLNQDLLDVAASESLSISKVPQEYFYEAENINRSDQYAFMKAGIPSLLVTEGVHYRHTPYRAGIKRMIDWNKSVYHTPFDDLSQDINFQAAVQHTQFIYQLILHVLDNPKVPQWHEGVPFINVRLQSTAEKR